MQKVAAELQSALLAYISMKNKLEEKERKKYNNF